MPFTRVERFLKSLEQATGTHVFNPWCDHDLTTDLARSAPLERRGRLTAHLTCKARYVFIGEAPGYQGCKVTGIPFTSERLYLEGKIPRLGNQQQRLTSRLRPWSEPSATTVWNTLHATGLAEHAILWNAFPWHPHQRGILHSNRTPTPAERASGLPILEALLALYPTATVFAVGRNAEHSLQQIGRAATPLRHPSMGGATRFAQQLSAAVASLV